MKKVLLTGFEPFGGADRNPAWDAVSQVADNPPDGVRIVAACLPVVFSGLRGRVAALLDGVDLAIAVGLAAGRRKVSIERVARNQIDARLPDNEGAQPCGVPVVPNGPPSRYSTLPLAVVLERADRAGCEVDVSSDAGGFVCNAAMYQLLDLTAATGVPAGFVHVPATGPDSRASHEVSHAVAGAPYVPLLAVTRALRTIVEACVRGAFDGEDTGR